MLRDVAVFLAAAVVAVPLFKRLGLGTVLGYLAAGALIGPSGLGFVERVEEVLHFSEFGVVLLLFVIGLELEPKRLWAMRRLVFVFGGAQVALTAGFVALGARAVGATWPVAIAVGLGLAMSSTAFATQVLAERNELGSAHGRAAFGMLLFQDLAAIPILALVPLLGTPTGGAARPAWQGALIAVGVIGGVVLAGRLLLRPLFGVIARSRSHELSVASALLVVVGTSLLMEVAGLSMALGAFLAGILLADSEYRHDLEANVEPFKGLLLGLFFIAVGMSADLGLLASRPGDVALATLALVGVKVAVLLALGRMAGLAGDAASRLAVAISQGGEFAFVVFAVALGAGVLDRATSQLLVVVITLSMVATPLLFVVRDRVARGLARPDDERPYDVPDGHEARVLIAGFGRFGQIVGRVLSMRRIPFTALDASATHVDFVRKFGNKIHYGDASRVDLLRAARADQAEVLVLAIDDLEASLRTLHCVQRHFPHLRIVARARNRQHAYALLAAGVETVIRETFAASVDAAQATLVALGVAPGQAREMARTFAAYDEEQVRAVFVHKDDEAKLVEQAKAYTAELERIFEGDARAR